jgi:hypothetical protein
MLAFHFKGKRYCGSSALEIVRSLESDEEDYPYRGKSIRRFLHWSLEGLRDRLPPRDLDLSNGLADNELALSYLYLRDEYGAGNLSTDA